MNLKNSVAPFKITEQGGVRWNKSLLVVVLSLLLVAVVATYAAMSLNELTARANPPAMDTEYALLAGNPELMAAHRSMIASNTARLAANPELIVAHGYTGGVEQSAGTVFLAANPELMVARPYVPPGGWTQRSLRAQENPELTVARRYAALHNRVDPDSDIGLLEFFKPQTINAAAAGRTYPLLGGR